MGEQSGSRDSSYRLPGIQYGVGGIGVACLGRCAHRSLTFVGWALADCQLSLPLPNETLMENVYRLGGHLAELAPVATLFTPYTCRHQRQSYVYSSIRC